METVADPRQQRRREFRLNRAVPEDPAMERWWKREFAIGEARHNAAKGAVHQHLLQGVRSLEDAEALPSGSL